MDVPSGTQIAQYPMASDEATSGTRAAEAIRGFADTLRGEANGIPFSRLYEVSAMDLFVCVRDELLLHEPQLGEERAEFIAEQTVRRVDRDPSVVLP